jgi:drug/metabolite transporter (DMT)-like permease
MSSQPQALTAKAWALIVALSIPWGGSFFFYRFLTNDFPPFTLVFGRLSISAMALYALVRISGRRLDIPWLAFFVMGMLNNAIPFTLIAWGETRITSGLAAILNATTPIFSAVVLHAFRTERLTPARAAGVLLGFAGVAILVGPDAWGLTRNLPAEAACLAASISYAFTALWSRRLRHIEPLVAATGQVMCSTMILAPLMLAFDRPWTLPMPGIMAWLGLLGLALISTALGYIIFFRILIVAGAGNLMLVTFLIPISTMLLGAAFLNESVTATAIEGMAVIATGLAAIDGRLLRFVGLGRPSQRHSELLCHECPTLAGARVASLRGPERRSNHAEGLAPANRNG